MSANFIYLWFVLYYSVLEQLKLYNGRGILHAAHRDCPKTWPQSIWAHFCFFFRSFSSRAKVPNDILTLPAPAVMFQTFMAILGLIARGGKVKLIRLSDSSSLYGPISLTGISWPLKSRAKDAGYLAKKRRQDNRMAVAAT